MSRWAVAPLYVLLAADIGNGCFALVTGAPATAAALALKATVALALLAHTAWTGSVTLALLTPLLCAASFAMTRSDALLPSASESQLLLLKTGGSTLLLALVSARVRTLPPALLARYLHTVLGVIALSLLLGFAGIGHDRYGDEDALLAANGFLPAGNEINIVLVALFWWLSNRRATGATRLVDRAPYWLCLALMLVSSSKTTIASAFVIALWSQRRRPLRLLGVLVLALIAFRALVAAAVWDRWLFFFRVNFEQGILSALTSGRFARAADALASWSALPLEGMPSLALYGYIESDALDLVLNFGVAGAALFACYAAVLWRAAGGRWLPWLLVLLTSVLAGHVVYSVFAAPVLACALARRRVAGIDRPSWQFAQQPVRGAARQ